MKLNTQWLFEYTAKDGQLLSGSVICRTGQKPDAKIQAIYGEKMNRENPGVINLRRIPNQL